MKTIALATLVVLTAVSAKAQSAAEQTGVNSMLGLAPTTEEFVVAVSASDMFEIASSKLALDRGADATITFARQMISDHEKTTAELKRLIEDGKVVGKPASEITEEHQEMLKEMADARGKEFTEAYHAAQVEAHENAVDLFERYAEGGDNPDLKAWAAKTLPALKHHQELAEALENAD